MAYCTAAVAFEDGRRPQFEIPYDLVVVAVGEKPATFGVPGVEEHAYFMKEVSDCVGLRKRIQEAFELAALPGTSEAERRKILHFVVSQWSWPNSWLQRCYAIRSFSLQFWSLAVLTVAGGVPCLSCRCCELVACVRAFWVCCATRSCRSGQAIALRT